MWGNHDGQALGNANPEEKDFRKYLVRKLGEYKSLNKIWINGLRNRSIIFTGQENGKY